MMSQISTDTIELCLPALLVWRALVVKGTFTVAPVRGQFTEIPHNIFKLGVCATERKDY
jgi:hypothetical protein